MPISGVDLQAGPLLSVKIVFKSNVIPQPLIMTSRVFFQVITILSKHSSFKAAHFLKTKLYY